MYSFDIYKEPFWAENSGFMNGRDPLGIQNSSVATYSKLLPGMTNQTSRIRYYGFYSWILSEYHKLEKKFKQSREDQFNFIRRSELIIAYLMVNSFQNEQNIVGSLFAKQNIDEHNSKGFYDISLGADKTKNTIKGSVYWDYSSGALGQYYAGSLKNLKLIDIRGRYFHILDKGSKLAEAYKENISESSINLFLKIVQNGKLKYSQIKELEEFSISNIPTESNEWHFYNSLILSDDGIDNKQTTGIVPSQRKETIKYFLEYLKNSSGNIEFKEYHYILNSNKISKDASFGWYYYNVLEMLHYSIESIFWGMLVYLDGQIIPIDDYLDVLTKLVYDELRKVVKIEKNNSISEIINKLEKKTNSLTDDFNSLIELVKSPIGAIETISKALKVILEIYDENQRYIENVKSFENVNYLTDKNGRISQIFGLFVSSHFEENVYDYIRNIIKEIINDHIATAYRKMGNGESNLLKFMIEDNNIIHIQTVEPGFTSPRLGTLHNFLDDLGYIKNNNKLSPNGRILLNRL